MTAISTDPLYRRFMRRAQSSMERGETDKVERWLLAAVGVANERCPAHLDATLALLASLYEQQQRWEEAAALQRQLGRRTALIRVLLECGGYDEAEPLLREEIAEAVPGSPALLEARRALARLHEDQGHYAAAEPLRCQIVEACERQGEPGRLAAELAHLASLYELLERDGDAEDLYLRSLGLAGGEADKRLVMECLRALGQIAEARGEWPEAEAMYREALDLEAARGEAAFVAQTALARVMARQEELEEAESLYVAALALHTSGRRGLRWAEAMQGLAEVLHRRGQGDRADEAAREAEGALRQWADAPLDPHPDVALSLDLVARSLRAGGRADMAEAVARRSATVREAARGRQGRSLFAR